MILCWASLLYRLCHHLAHLRRLQVIRRTVVKGVGVVSLFVGIYPLELCACRVVLNVHIFLHLNAGHLVVLVVANLHLPHHHCLGVAYHFAILVRVNNFGAIATLNLVVLAVVDVLLSAILVNSESA